MRTTFLLCCTLIGSAFAQSADSSKAVSPAEREAHWRQDLQALALGLKAPGIKIAGGIATRGQKDFADVYPNFDTQIASIAEAIPNLTDPELYLRLTHLIASAHIAHNTMDIPLGMGFLVRLPIDFRWFADGLVVNAATADYQELLGARVRTIGGKAPEQFLTDLAPYISYENETWLRVKSIDLMPASGVLQHFGMLDADHRVSLQLEKTGGEVVTVSMPVVLGNVKKIGMSFGLHIPTVAYNSHPDAWYWSQYLADSQTLFIQYNRCENDSTHHFGDVARQAFAEAKSHPVKRVVIDLRWNGGGDSRVIRPLMSGLASRRKDVGEIFALIGPYTFSSALDNAQELHKDLSAILVGEPTGGALDGYGEVSNFTLPNSKLVIRFTTKRWGVKGGAHTTLIPDLPVAFKLADFIAGHDPALEAAIAYR
jgi:hypothetical protein